MPVELRFFQLKRRMAPRPLRSATPSLPERKASGGQRTKRLATLPAAIAVKSIAAGINPYAGVTYRREFRLPSGPGVFTLGLEFI
jgi:hypothetical protein